MLVREAKDRSVSAWINEMFLAFTWTQAKKFPAQAMEFVMGWGKQGSEKSLPCLSLSATYLCTAQENVHSPPKIILWEFFIFKKRNNFCISKLFSWAIRSSTLLQKGWAALLIHMQERQQKKKKKKRKKTTCTLIMQRLCLTNQEMYPFFCHVLRSRAANSYYHLLSLNRLVLEVTSRQHALLKGKTPHTHLSL